MENCEIHLNFSVKTLTNISNSLDRIAVLTKVRSLNAKEVKSLYNVLKNISDSASDCVQTIKNYE